MTHPLLARLRDAARQNAVPGVVLQTLTLALLLGYYRLAPVHDALRRLLRLKLAWGAGYSFLAGALFAGLLPRLVLRLKGAGGRRFAVELAFACAFWGWRSVEVDLFYRLQAHWFGAGADWATDPATQIRWGLGYIQGTYGDPCKAWAFWQTHSYY